jgi:hypothetical protein
LCLLMDNVRAHQVVWPLPNVIYALFLFILHTDGHGLR